MPSALDDADMEIFRFLPWPTRCQAIARADDPNWLSANSSGKILVAARTIGDARIVAAERELDFMDIDATPAGDKTTRMASAFCNEKLYPVIEVDDGNTYHERGVISGTIGMDTIISTQV
ncbi:hypothetical protein [Rhizobium rhizogenes]|uniref:hypothetical protein n=1 Tax=Rhizobium rhizogenes TaxID=359 RepID=UPI001F1C486A|nr:hypothetical protein [Rhizobium rhizogenes]